MSDLPGGWELAPFESLLTVVSDGGRRVKQSEYLTGGKLPIVDQGDGLIGGFINDEDLAYDGPLPVIVFGDHTRRFKFVDFAFAVGAEGTKLLAPHRLLNPRFLYYQLLSLNLPNRGYGRHFALLRAVDLLVAPRAQQDRIVAAIEEHLSRLDAAVTLLSAAALRVRVLPNCAWPEPGECRWPLLLLSEVLQEKGGRQLRQGWSPRCERYPSPDDQVWGVLKTSAIQLRQFTSSENKALPASLTARPELEIKSGDLLITSGGPRSRIGVVCLAEKPRPRLMASDKMFIFRPDPRVLDPRFLLGYLTSASGRTALERLKTGSNDSGLRISQVAFLGLRVPVPPLRTQELVVQRMSAIGERTALLTSALSTAMTRSKALRKMILRAAFAGHLVSQDPNDEPASVLLDRIRAERAPAAPTKRTRKVKTS